MSFITEAYNMESNDLLRELSIMEEAADLDFMKIDHMFAMVEGQYDINVRASELKVVQESGDFSDLEALYEAANAEATEKKKGIIASAFGAVRTLFSNIQKFVREKILGIKSDASIEVDESVVQNYDNAMKARSGIRNCFAKLKGGLSANDVLKAVGAVGAVIVSVPVVGKVVTLASDKWKGMCKNLDDASKEIEMKITDLATIPDSESDKVKKIVDILRKYGKMLMDFLKSIVTKIRGAASDVTKKATQKKLTGPTMVDGKATVVDESGAVATKESAEEPMGDSENKDDMDPVEEPAAEEPVQESSTFGVDYSYDDSMAELESMIDNI